jgi:hypothetical protein
VPIPHGGIPAAARATGFDDRFHFWIGASGRRYLFTAVAADALAHFRDVVVLVAERRPHGAPVGRSVFVTDGEGASREAMFAESGVKPSEAALFVHLLADTPDARRAVAADLSAISAEQAA